MPVRGYKGRTADHVTVRETLLNVLNHHWDIADFATELSGSDDILDAAVRALEGANFLKEGCIAPNEEQIEDAETERWIWFAG